MSASEAARDVALNDLAEEFLARFRRGERPSLAEYVARRPDLADDIRDLFPALVGVERLVPPDSEPSVPAASRLPERLGEFRILREVGRGGRAIPAPPRRRPPCRRVALKVLPPTALLNPTYLERFRREAKAAAKLHHTNIVPVFGVGEADGVPYYAMQFIQGESLDRILDDLRRRRLGLAATEPPSAASLSDDKTEGEYFRRVARVGAQAAEALAHAHQQGVLHRDVKPSNLLLDADGTVWVADFGLAKMESTAEGEHDLTHTGDVVGTVRYMAPERFDGRSLPQSDVYALGLTLYELLTLRPAFDDLNKARLIQRVLQEPPEPPSRLVPALPRDLDTICLKCLEKEPERRYATAAALADDLHRFLKGEPVAARPPGRVERARMWARRHRAATALIAVSLASLLLLLAGSVAFSLQLSGTLAQVREQKRIADDALLHSGEDNYAVRVALAERELRDGHASRALALLDGAALAPRGWEFAHLRGRALGGGRCVPLVGHAGEVRSVRFGDGGRLVATGSNDGTVRLWDAADGRERLVLRHDGPTVVVAFCDNDTSLICYDVRGLHSWDAATGRARSHIACSLAVPPSGRRLVCGPDGGTLAAAGNDGRLTLIDTATGRPRASWVGHDGPVYTVAFSADGRLLASGGDDGVVRVWDAATGRERATCRGHDKRPVVRVAFLPAGDGLLSACEDGSWRLWDAGSGRQRYRSPTGNQALNDMDISPDGRRLATIEHTGRGRLWERNDDQGRLLSEFLPLDAGKVAYSPDGQRLALYGGRPVVTLIDVRHPPDRLLLRGHSKETRGLAWFADGRRLASASGDGRVTIWDAASGHERRSWPAGHGDFVSGVAAGGGSLLATASYDGTARVWDADHGRLLRTLVGHEAKIQNIAFFPDGRRLATASKDGTVRVWNAETGDAMQVLRHASTGVWSVVVSADGRRLAAGRYDGLVSVWDVAAGTEERTLDGFERDGFTEIAFRPDGRRLAACGGQTRRVVVWDLETGQKVVALTGLDADVWHVAYSPDGRRLATACEDGTIKLWDADAGRELLLLAPHTAPAWRVAFSPDGRRLASSGVDGLVQVWDTAAGLEVLTRRDHGEEISGVAVAPGSGWLAVATHKQTNKQHWQGGTRPVSDIGLWDIAARREVRRLDCRLVMPQVVFSADGRRVGAVDAKGEAQAWDVATGEEVADIGTPPPPSDNPQVAVLGSSRRRAVAAGRQVWLLDAEPSEETLAERRAWSAPDGAWHARQADDAEKAKAWFAAAFHWRQVLAARPDDAEAKSRLEAAERRAGLR